MATSYEAHTKKAYQGLEDAYKYFNKELWGNKLPGCLITLQRSKRARGYFANSRFQSGKSKADEIALNPKAFAGRSPEEVLSTLVHEMAHLWQQHLGTPPKTAWHDKAWSAEMKRIGLFPSQTGYPGGKEYGRNCSHYIVAKGPFQIAAREFLKKGTLALYTDNWGEDKDAAKKRASKTKFCCPSCDAAAWGKATLNITCTDCDEVMEAE